MVEGWAGRVGVGVARRQSAAAREEGSRKAKALYSERGQIKDTAEAQPNAVMGGGGGSTGRCVAGVRRAGCHEANGKCAQHRSETSDWALPSLGALGSRTCLESEGPGQNHPYLALQLCPPLRSGLENAAAGSRAARLRFLIG